MPQTVDERRNAELRMLHSQMHLGKYYQGSAVELIDRARYAAQHMHHARLEAVHLLYAMVIMGNGGTSGAPKAPADLCRCGASREKLIMFFDARPELTRPGDHTLVLQESFLRVLRRARRIAKRRASLMPRRELKIGHRDVLVALLHSRDPLVREAIIAMGIDRAELLKKYSIR